jgi:DNA-binding SARP family transcriptional activator
MAPDSNMTTGVAPTRIAPAPTRTEVQFRVLGPLAVESNGRAVHVAGTQRRRLLALLASRAGRVASVELIVDSLWGDDPPPSAVKTIQSHVVRLRRSLAQVEGELIETVPGGYRLAVDAEWVDAGQFERLAKRGEELVRSGDHAAAIDVLVEAAELWRGPAYVEFRETEFAMAEGVRLDELRLVASELLAESQIVTGSAAGAIPGLERLVRDEPGREHAWALLMRALCASGRQHEALGAFKRARKLLAVVGSYGAGGRTQSLDPVRRSR